MKRPYLPFLAFLFLLLITVPFSFDFAISVAPGWHTTILPSDTKFLIVGIVVLLFVIIGYWLIIKKTGKVNRGLFWAHFILTISTITYIHYPMIFVKVEVPFTDELIRIASQRLTLLDTARIAFAASQVLFLIYFVRTVRKKT